MIMPDLFDSLKLGDLTLLSQAQVGVCGNYIDVVGLHARSLPHFRYWHLRGL